jgi:cob(I)alamin adenosyltransferase
MLASFTDGASVKGMNTYTRRGDDRTTGLLFGGRVTKNEAPPMAYGGYLL